MYKESIYNIDISSENGKTLIFNTASGALANFDEEALSRFRNVAEITSDDNLSGEIQNGFVVPLDKDETIDYINKVYDYAHNNDEKLHVVMVPSLACNYRCKYCFEAEVLSNSKCIDDELVDKSILFIKNYLIQHRCKYLTIEWFGGEPLLQKDIIFKVAPDLITFCKEHNINFNSHMISNGKLLTRDIADRLINECGITMIQITLDGLAEKYAYMKGCTEEDFYTVIENLKSLKGSGIKINLRINVSNNTMDDIKSLLEYIYIINDIHYGFYIADVRNYGDCKFSPDAFYKFKQELVEWICTKDKIFSYMDLKLPLPRFSSCKSTSKELITIDYKGRLYQCAHLIDRFDSSGDVISGINEESETRKRALDNELPDKCKQCKFMPICLGNCYADRVIEGIVVDCDGYTEDIKRTIKLWYDSKRR